MTKNGRIVKRDFIREIIDREIKEGRFTHVNTRFPPEPNAYGHLGHAYAALFNYNLAREYGGRFNLRFDDTNPETEKQEYVDAFIEDLQWLGIECDRIFYASDYFEQMYEYALALIRKGKAFVCDQSLEDIRQYRGTAVFDEKGKRKTPAGRNSPFRDRTVEENLDLFEQMNAGRFPDGSRTLRAKIDMAHPNLNMRDPVMYRIAHVPHYRQGDTWCIYPMYDWAHGLEDSIEGITYSICSIEFENHRPLYDWYLEQLGVHHPQQLEFARLNLTHTVTSKRKILELIHAGLITGFDDPRLCTIRGMRRRGYTPEAVRDFLEKLGASKSPSTVDMSFLEYCIRQDLNKKADRRFCVINPVKVIIENYPEDFTEELDAANNPENESAGMRKVPFCRELYIEADDFMEEPSKKFFRLAPGREVRLRYAYFITCSRVEKHDDGSVKHLLCTYDPETRGGDAPDGRKVKGTVHWVSARHACEAEIRLYGYLSDKENPIESEDGGDWQENISRESRETVTGCMIEPFLEGSRPGYRCQFERKGYFCVDPDSSPERLVFNRIVELKDT